MSYGFFSIYPFTTEGPNDDEINDNDDENDDEKNDDENENDGSAKFNKR